MASLYSFYVVVPVHYITCFYHMNCFWDTSPMETSFARTFQEMVFVACLWNRVAYTSGEHKSGLDSNTIWASDGCFFTNTCCDLLLLPERLTTWPKPIFSSSTAAALNCCAVAHLRNFQLARIAMVVDTGPTVCKMAAMMLRLETMELGLKIPDLVRCKPPCTRNKWNPEINKPIRILSSEWYNNYVIHDWKLFHWF